MIKDYSLNINGEDNLSENFKAKEFACHDGSDYFCVDSILVNFLQKIRNHFNKSVYITSGYRNKSWNAKVGGSPNSQHLLGKAADIIINGVPLIEVARYIEHLLPTSGGIGLYGDFIHIDTRNTRSRWVQDHYEGVKTVSGFPGYVKDNEKGDMVSVLVKCPYGQREVVLEGLRLGDVVYAPVRQIGEALGQKVKYEDGKVVVGG